MIYLYLPASPPLFEIIRLVMKLLELKPDQLPLIIRLKVWNETKEYVLLKTKQDKLLLNKPNGERPTQNT